MKRTRALQTKMKETSPLSNADLFSTQDELKSIWDNVSSLVGCHFLLNKALLSARASQTLFSIAHLLISGYMHSPICRGRGRGDRGRDIFDVFASRQNFQLLYPRLRTDAIAHQTQLSAMVKANSTYRRGIGFRYVRSVIRGRDTKLRLPHWAPNLSIRSC
jgi:hypothetical protein